MAATTGEQIADAVGLSVRSLWRHFHNKESCAEPILVYGVAWLTSVFHRWPPELSFAEHYAKELSALSRSQVSPQEQADDLAARQMIVLAGHEPALRTAWLMACDHLEREFAAVIANRLQRAPENPDVRLHAAAATSVVRVISEDLAAAHVNGADAPSIESTLERVVQALRAATGSVLDAPYSLNPHIPEKVKASDELQGRRSQP